MALTFFVPAVGDVQLVPVWPHAGVPVNGTSGTFAGLAQPGDLLADTTNKVLYQNTNTLASPTWSSAGIGTSASVAITGGTIDGTPIGGTTPAAVTTNALHVDTGTKTATATSGAATLNKMAGVITSESITTAAGSLYTLTVTDSDAAAADQIFASVQNGSNTQGTPCVTTVASAAGSFVVIVKNIHATQAFNGTILVSFAIIKN